MKLLKKKYSDQQYKVIVKAIATQEIVLERRDLGPHQSVTIFNALKEQFGIEGDASIKYRNTIMFVKNRQYSIKLLKQRRKRLL